MKLSRLLVVVGLGLVQPASVAADCYFVVVFGAQRPVIKMPRYSHSFATFVHQFPDGRLEAFSISWLPQTGRVRPLWPWPETGRNFPLDETLQLCCANRMQVACWGPYQIHPDLWQLAQWQRSRLESGQVLYKAFDDGSPEGRVSNCLHAIEFLTRPPGQTRTQVLVAPSNWGESGSYWIALTLRPWLVEPCRTCDWLLPSLGLNPAGLIRYGLGGNPANPLTAAIQAPLHAPLLPNRVCCEP
jgi:hypothetical protein